MKTQKDQLFFARRRQGGFTFFELIAVVAIIGAGIFLLAKQKKGSEVRSQAAQIQTNMNYVQSKVPELYPTNFAGLTCPILANNNVFEGTTFRVDRSGATPAVLYGNDPTNTVACAPVNLFGTNDGYTMTFNNLSNNLCSETVDKLNAASWVITVNGTSVKAARGALDQAAKGTQCTATATADAQTVVVTLARTLPPQ